MRYIEKTIPTDHGIDCSCWIVTDLKVKLDLNPSANIIIAGFASPEAYLANKVQIGYRTVHMPNIEQLMLPMPTAQVYEAVSTSVVGCILADPEFQGALVKHFDV